MPSSSHGPRVESNSALTAEAAALEYRRLGHAPIWLPAGRKKPPPTGIIGYKGRRPTEKDYKAWHGQWGNIALALSRELCAVGIDLDLHSHVVDCEKCAEATAKLGPRETRETMLKLHGYDPLPPSRWSTSRTNGSGIAMFRVPPGTQLATELPGGLGETCQFFHRYVCCWPSIHPDTGEIYRWLDDDGNEVDIPDFDDLADLPANWLTKLQRTLKHKESTSGGFIGDVDDWMDQLADGPMDPNVQQTLDKHLAELKRRAAGARPADKDDGRSRYDAMVKATGALVGLGGTGHRGVREAIDTYCAEYRACVEGEPDREPDGELGRAIEGAVADIGGNPGWYSKNQAKVRSNEQEELDFWETRDELQLIRDYAWAGLAAPYAVLGYVALRVLAAVPPEVVLPKIGHTGKYASLNLYAALVGDSGDGKGVAAGVAEELLPVSVPVIGTGSGEGLCHAFAHYNRKTHMVVRDHTSVLIDIPEIDSLGAVKGRLGSTISAELRKGWMGELLGFQYADPTKRLPVAAHSYRLGLAALVQPPRAGTLLDDADGGLPQRFNWFDVIDPSLPDDAGERPAPANTLRPGKGPAKPMVPGAHRVIKVCAEVRESILAEQRARRRGEDTGHGAHEMLMREKWAEVMSLLRGDGATINAEDWELAGHVIAVSNRTLAKVVKLRAEAASASNRARGHQEGERAVLVDAAKHANEVQRVIRVMEHKAKRDGPLAKRGLRDAVAGRDRELFEEALGLALDTSRITFENGKYSA